MVTRSQHTENMSKAGNNFNNQELDLKYKVDDAVVKVSEKINLNGYNDNKNKQIKIKSEFYQTLRQEQDERERLRQIILKEGIHIG